MIRSGKAGHGAEQLFKIDGRRARRRIIRVAVIARREHRADLVFHIFEIIIRYTHFFEYIVYLRYAELLCAFEAKTLVFCFAVFHSGDEYHSHSLMAS